MLIIPLFRKLTPVIQWLGFLLYIKHITMQNFHILLVSAMPPTESNPARVKIKSEWFKNTIYIGFDNEAGAFNPALDTAVAWLQFRGFNIIGTGQSEKHYYIITPTFNRIANK